jgi:cytidylate kinase
MGRVTGNIWHVEDSPGVVVAVDGPSGSGKSSASRGVARALGLRYLDTGAMYRALTWWMLEHGTEVTDGDAVASQAGIPEMAISTDPDTPYVCVDGRDVTTEIRTHRVTTTVSYVAKVPQVRTRLIGQQREIIAAARTGIVVEGRDIGAVVAPDAPVKVYLTADGQARAARHADDQGTTVSQTESDQARRDRLDAAQSEKAPDAVIVDSTNLELDEVIAVIADMTRRIPEQAR